MRFSIAFDDNWNVESPTWTRIDTAAPVLSCRVDRGRVFETDRIDPGRASVTFVDKTGAWDPMNAAGTYYGKCVPRRQAKLELVNPGDASVNSIFRGYVSGWRFNPYPTEDWIYVTVELVDGLAVLAETELMPDGTFGTVTNGNIVYDADTALTACRTRIVQVLDECAWPGTTETDTLRKINSGNVGLLETVYAPRTSALAVIQDAADAEFPTVANFYMAKDGKATFHGRYPRFNPADVSYGIQTWTLGDRTAVNAAPSSTVPLSPPVVYYVDESQLYNEAIALPKDVADADIAGQYVSDATSIGKYGRRSWSAEGLLTGNGEGPTTALAETELFAQYVVDNYKDPQVRVESLTIRPQPPASTPGGPTWDLLCGVELNDIVEIGTTHMAGGFSGDEFFVEGIHYDIQPMNTSVDEVTLTLDVSPRSYYTSNPFAGP